MRIHGLPLDLQKLCHRAFMLTSRADLSYHDDAASIPAFVASYAALTLYLSRDVQLCCRKKLTITTSHFNI